MIQGCEVQGTRQNDPQALGTGGQGQARHSGRCQKQRASQQDPQRAGGLKVDLPQGDPHMACPGQAKMCELLC